MRRPMLAFTTLTALLAAGCGIPTDSGVTVVGAGPTSGAVADGPATAQDPYTRQPTTDALMLVDHYLQAAAGDPEGALARVKSFLTDGEAAKLEKSVSGSAVPDVKVVRSTESALFTPGDDHVTVHLQQIGTLKSNGVLEPADPSATPVKYDIGVGYVPGRSGMFIDSAPPGLVMLDKALDGFYQQRTIYFWNRDYTGLVPDVRYMPRILPMVQQPTTILNWLVNGPAQWLSDAVQPLPPGTTAPDNVPAISNDTLQITLGPQAVPVGNDEMMNRLRRQLQWSLRPLLPHTLELRIGKQDPVSYTDAEYLTSNRAYLLPNNPDKFVVFNGAVRRRDESPHVTDPVPVLKPADDKGIATAAMSNSAARTFAAVVTAAKTPKLRVGSAARGAQGDLKDVAGLSGALGRPVWARTDDDPAKTIGLITANGRLYSFGGNGSAARRVEWPGAPGPITGLSVAPDGVRVAVASGGKLYRTVLDADGQAVRLSTPDVLSPPTLTQVSAVAWSSEGWLTAAGVDRGNGRVTILDVSVDGMLQHPRLTDIGEKPVTYLSAYPSNPVDDRPNTNWVSYTAAGASWDAFSAPDPILAGSVYGLTGNPPAGVKPTAPFFLDD